MDCTCGWVTNLRWKYELRQFSPQWWVMQKLSGVEREEGNCAADYGKIGASRPKTCICLKLLKSLFSAERVEERSYLRTLHCARVLQLSWPWNWPRCVGAPGLLGRGLLSWSWEGGGGRNERLHAFLATRDSTHPTSSLVQIENPELDAILIFSWKVLLVLLYLIIWEECLVCLLGYWGVLWTDWVARLLWSGVSTSSIGQWGIFEPSYTRHQQHQ